MSKISRAVAELIWGVKKEYITSYKKLVDLSEQMIDTVKVRVYKEDKNISLPTYSKNGDACMDVTATSIEYDKDKNRFICHTGLHFSLPEDYEIEIRPRSSNTKFRVIISNAPGTLDSGYRGEMLIIFTPIDIPLLEDYFDSPLDNFPYKAGDRIAQILVRRRERIIWEEVETLEDLGSTDRGIGGFGSTGGIEKEK